MNENLTPQLDVLRRIESLTSDMDSAMRKRSRSLFRRYPITFTLCALFGISAVSEGIKGLLESVPFLGEHPGYMLVLGIVVLVVTGSLYKKLDK